MVDFSLTLEVKGEFLVVRRDGGTEERQEFYLLGQAIPSLVADCWLSRLWELHCDAKSISSSSLVPCALGK